MEINSFTEFHSVFGEYRKNNQWMFRGQANESWEVKPKAGRHPYLEKDDLEYLEGWKRKASEYIKAKPQNDWEWMAIAQHHGLPTRLLDWSYNPLVAAFLRVSLNLRKMPLFTAYPHIGRLSLIKRNRVSIVISLDINLLWLHLELVCKAGYLQPIQILMKIFQKV